MDQKLRLMLTLLMGGTLIFGLWFFAKTITSLTGYTIGGARFDQFAQCLSENNVVLYTSDKECETCTQQRALFKNSYQHLQIVNCREEQETCDALEIKFVPVWIIDGKKYFGLHGVPRLAELTGCEI